MMKMGTAGSSRMLVALTELMASYCMWQHSCHSLQQEPQTSQCKVQWHSPRKTVILFCNKYSKRQLFSDLQTVSCYVTDTILTNTISNPFHHLPKAEWCSTLSWPCLGAI
jgi:hypothetical protein